MMNKNPFGMPRLRQRKISRRLSPAMSLLHRLREAVFRLIMLSALSKGSDDVAHPSCNPYYYYPNDSHHSEAVADCIEFIKKSATTSETNTPDGYSDSAAAVQVVNHLPVV